MENKKIILFQGDSITDAYRAGVDIRNMGCGYPTLVSGEIGFDYPGQYEFYNRGVGGNRIVDIYARIKMDILSLKPDILSILVGVNDVWHEIMLQNGIDADKYFKIYCMLIEEIKEALPDTKIMILEPFVLRASATEERWDEFWAEMVTIAQKAREVAEKYDLLFIPLQGKFDEAAKLAPNEYWLFDGVHPMAAGYELIKRAWLEGFCKIVGGRKLSV